ncbi:hypothetical protein Tco_0155823 [Tanacetum coccineum]|uniref:Uncharacterized protein n=1 Tax=Tanacetum coccineum TaxID=301880 RepID=A0ABQ4ZGX5_9ASTR
MEGGEGDEEDVEAVIKRLKLELSRTMEMYSSAAKSTYSKAKQKVYGTPKVETRGATKGDESRENEESVKNQPTKSSEACSKNPQNSKWGGGPRT